MTIVRWIFGVLAALFALGALLGLFVSVGFDNDVWRQRTRRLRAWLWVVALAWFNTEVWGRVVWTLLHWNS